VKKVLTLSYDVHVVYTAAIEVHDDPNLSSIGVSDAIIRMVGQALNGQPNVIPETIRFSLE
jgi:hypothetical protein